MVEPAALRPMTPAEFDAYRRRSVASYGEELAGSGAMGAAEAAAESERQFARFLPEGADTAGMRLLLVLDDAGARAGVLWVGPHPRRGDAGWVYDIEVDEDRRGQGFGRRAMLAAEGVCREAGWSALGLNVFGPNTSARGLYDSLGYEVVSTTMLKPLTP